MKKSTILICFKQNWKVFMKSVCLSSIHPLPSSRKCSSNVMKSIHAIQVYYIHNRALKLVCFTIDCMKKPTFLNKIEKYLWNQWVCPLSTRVQVLVNILLMYLSRCMLFKSIVSCFALKMLHIKLMVCVEWHTKLCQFITVCGRCFLMRDLCIVV